MKVLRNAAVLFLLVMCSVTILGCGKKADETTPMSEVQAEAEKMDAGQLRSVAMDYKDAIVAKKGELEKVAAKLKEIPVAEMMGEQAKGLKADIESLEKSVSALKARFDVYYGKLKEAKGDVSGLEI
jgi:uncharacterized lipoprotein YehR (DUF1307 family)